MSTSYEIVCVDCTENMGWMHDTDHMLDLMYAMRNNFTNLAIMGDLIETMNGIDFEIKVGYGRLTIPWDFIKKHSGHRIEVYDEYGGMLGDCNKSIACGECKHRDRCRLIRNHEGECSAKPVDGRKLPGEHER